MTEQYSKLTWETRDYNGIVHSVTLYNNSAEVSIEKFYVMCQYLALAAGYHPDNVKEWFEEG